MTEHFTFEELTRTNHENWQEKNREVAKNFITELNRTAQALEEIRALLDVPIIVSSGFRCEGLNHLVGGVQSSGHTKGRCADIKPKMDIYEAFERILSEGDKCPTLRKCIYEKVEDRVWLHIESKMNEDQPQQFFVTNDGRTYKEVKKKV